MINSLLLTFGIPKYLWGEGLNTACNILKKVPLKHNASTPFELWKGRKPHKRKKLGPKTVDVVFLCYVETSYALRFQVIRSEIPGIEINTIVEFHDAIFLEDIFPMKTGIPSSVSLDDSLPSTSISKHESDELKRSKRARVLRDSRSDFVTYNIEDDPITFKYAILRKLSSGKKLSKVTWTPLFLTGHGC
ncbi:UNVERIFIED_CONTAM: hypothetical protein Sindi_1426400 [Sesamum indicum]